MAKSPIQIETLRHKDATRRNIPTAEYEGVLTETARSPIRVAYERRNQDLDPQLVWRGKDEQDWSDLVVQAPPLYIQEKVHPKVLVDDLLKETKDRSREENGSIPDLFSDFNGLANKVAATEFYKHDQHWSNRMICGDSLAVMASLAEREGLRGKVQCIYIDPPYGIKFNSNFQWSTTSRDVKDGAKDHITREPEQVRAFRDTWRDGIHSYLTYLRDRLTVARDLLHESGSIFVQIGDENVHRVRALMDEVFGDRNFCCQITFRKTTGKGSGLLDNTVDFLLWYTKDIDKAKYRSLYEQRDRTSEINLRFLQTSEGMRRPMTKEEFTGRTSLPNGAKVYRPNPLTSARPPQVGDLRSFAFWGRYYSPGGRTFSTNVVGMEKLRKADRLLPIGTSLNFLRYLDDFAYRPRTDVWEDTRTGGFGDEKYYVVQTVSRVIERCILMTTDPGDLVLDPTCGSGTTATVAEEWGRRWITIDTSRVAIALARSRLMGARYPYYLLADSPEGQRKEGEVTRAPPKTVPTCGDIRHGFVYERVPHITLKSIANNAEIDVIWEKRQPAVNDARTKLNAALRGFAEPFKVGTGGRAGSKIDFTVAGEIKLPSGESAPANGFMEWEIPREAPEGWPQSAKDALSHFWEARLARQKDIDASIAAKAEFEYLFDKPYEDKAKIRVAGPFTVESLSPHRTLAVGVEDELIDPMKAMVKDADPAGRDASARDFTQMILENLCVAGVQQMEKGDKITFSSVTAWPGGGYICAEGTYLEGNAPRRAAILVGPEFGSVSRADLVAAAKQAADENFDALIACSFNYDAASTEFDRMGRIPVLKARMNPDLLMAKELKTTSAGNLFVVFGEPDIDLERMPDTSYRVKVHGVDVFKPQTGEVISSGTDGIALWMIDTDYNEESFFVRHAYFLGANDPYKSLKTTLKAEIDEEAWQSLYSDTSRPFPKPTTGRIAVKVINHLGDEVMKILKVS